MLIIRKKAHARAGLIGNPSDAYHGKTISLILRNFAADVVLYPWDDVELVLSQNDQNRFRSVYELVRDVELHGYYGGIRLVKATIKKFVEYCQRQGHTLDDRNFSVRYESNIPRQVGLGGSSAIIVATLRCLMEFYRVEIPREVQPSLALSVETEELGIAGGLQDRVVQVYEGVVSMDFAHQRMHTRSGYECGDYQPLDAALLPPLYVAYKTDVSEPTEVFHNNLRARFDAGEQAVVDAMGRFADLAAEAKAAILARDASRLGRLIDANYDLRQSICKLPPQQVEMIRTARRWGATAKFAGSGGAIVGTYSSEEAFRELQAELESIRCRVIRPTILAE